MRVLDILSPITRDPQYDGPISVPQEGELLVGKVGTKIGILYYNLDAQSTKFIATLRRLWDSDVKFGTIPGPHPPSQCAD